MGLPVVSPLFFRSGADSPGVAWCSISIGRGPHPCCRVPAPELHPLLPKRTRDSHPCGPHYQPPCATCEHPPPPARPLRSTTPRAHRGRRRQVDTSHPLLARTGLGRYHGWVGWAISAPNGIHGGPGGSCCGWSAAAPFSRRSARSSWQAVVRSSASYAHRVPGRTWASGARRRVEVDPRTVRQWLVEPPPLPSLSCHVLHDVRVRQVQLDDLSPSHAVKTRGP